MINPTHEVYRTFQDAYDFFNKRLFGDSLPVCLITFQRQKRIMSYVSLERWIYREDGKYIHELAINPEYFANYPLIEILQNLCHEMVHVWQATFGTPGRRGYHNLEWARIMIEVGLMPSTTGRPGGEIIGETVSDYIIDNGPFDKAFQELASTGLQLKWLDRYPVIKTQHVLSESPNDAMERSPVPLTLRHIDAVATATAPLDLPYSFEELDAAFTSAINAQFSPASLTVPTTRPQHRSAKHKYRCPKCAMLLWGKPDLSVICGECELPLVETE